MQLARDLQNGIEPLLPCNPAMFGVRAIDVKSQSDQLETVVEMHKDALWLPAG